MKIIISIAAALVICAGIYSDASARFRLWEVRGLAGMSVTTINQLSVRQVETNQETEIINSEENLTGIPFGLRFVLASAEEGLAFNINLFMQPILSDNAEAEYLVSQTFWSTGAIDRTYWDAGGAAEITYRFASPFPGSYIGAGIGLHRVADKTAFAPPLYLAADFPLPIELIDNSEFRAGIHILAGIPFHRRFALEARYEKINDFNQYKVGISIGFWTYQ